ncbi:MAG: prolyl oligopeptidase family serine peptidase, partial [Firmicutes bacterium]|nr:prolyl oligopeptidase family serine peptidase [Bacillota bacterium]
AMADPKRFSCIAPICGSGIYWNAASVKDLPIMIYHGDNDEAVPITESIAMMKAVNKLGGHAEIKICYGKGHNVWEIAYQDPALYDWMMKQKRK